MFPDNTYEVFAYIAQPKSKALGAAEYQKDNIYYYVAGPITSEFDLIQNCNFTESKFDHSAQFNGINMQSRADYWEEILFRCGLK